MPVGFPTKVNYATGDVLSATNMNDLSGTVNLLQSAQYAAGKNAIINGDFGVWQRGTSGFALGGSYNADRWGFYTGTVTNKSVTQQTFTPGTAPVAGYEGQFFWRYAETVATVSDANVVYQRIEDVRTFAGQTATLSFWAKSTTTSSTILPRMGQNFGSGGSGTVLTDGSIISLTTSWARYSVTLSIPSISGKTIGASSYLETSLRFSTNLIQTIDIWGVQVEAGSTASPFQTATGTKQGELAACQRYLPAFTTNDFFLGGGGNTSSGFIVIPFVSSARVVPTGITVGAMATYQLQNAGGTSGTPTSIAFDSAGTENGRVLVNWTAGSPTVVGGQVTYLKISSGTILFTGCEL
jgi:hypothetical protein